MKIYFYSDAMYPVYYLFNPSEIDSELDPNQIMDIPEDLYLDYLKKMADFKEMQIKVVDEIIKFRKIN